VPSSLSRRSALALIGLGSAALLTSRARGDSAPKLDPNDPTARALGYVENAASVDKKKYPAFIAGSNCDNCLQLEGKPGNEYRPCKIFQGKLVAVAGWCSAWTAEI
jgi:hypothetical protein